MEQEALQRRQQRKIERAQRPTYRLPDFNSDFLEDDYGEGSSEEEHRPSSRAMLSSRRYSDDDESDGAGRLQEAKRGAAVIKGKATVKRRSRRSPSPAELSDGEDDRPLPDEVEADDDDLNQIKRSAPKRRRVVDSDSE
jgi:hypothetical protein